MGSSRFPGKPLAHILGVPMVGHVYFRSKLSPMLDEVFVATCDVEIREYVESVGGNCIMTAHTHERASDRVAEAAEIIEKQKGTKADIVVLIQGDEPMIIPDMIEESVTPLLQESSIVVTNLMGELRNDEEHKDTNEIKVVVDLKGFALYFSREPIPSGWKSGQPLPLLKQVCVISFRRDFLSTFSQLPETPLERIESVDMLRILEHGYKVKMVPTKTSVYSVDTIEELKEVETLMRNDPLLKLYAHETVRH